MSYKVYARRFRPVGFEEVIGQEHVVETLKRALQKQSVAHAYVFCGTRGVGKTSMARILAKALNCDSGPTDTPCGVCPSCTAIAAGNSFDVVEVDGASNNGVEQIRDLRDSVAYGTYEGKYKVYVIDEVHMLSRGAFNAFLKTLEEPPERVVFVLATTEPHKIPDTILSRCQRFDFKALSTKALQTHLEDLCTQEDIPFERDAISLIAKKAQGSVRDSLSLLEQCYAFSAKGLTRDSVACALGVIADDVYGAILSAVSKRSAETALEELQAVLDAGYNLKEFVLGFMEYLRRILCNYVQDTTFSYLSFRQGDILRCIELLRQCEFDMQRSSLPDFQVELTVIKMCSLDTLITLEDLLQQGQDHTAPTVHHKEESIPSVGSKAEKDVSPQVKKEERAVASETTYTPAPIPPDEAREVAEERVPCEAEEPAETTEASHAMEHGVYTPDNHEKAQVFWREFLQFASNKKPVMGAWLELGRVIAFTENSIDVRFSPMHSFQQMELANPKNRAVLEELLREYSGSALTLHITTEAEVPQDSSAPPVSEESGDSTGGEPVYTGHEASLQDEVAREPIIKDVLELFDGELL
ncbi:DNA polymerase III subunit gamma/tau [Chitinivibrio alkaliphilus]|nr:DNA polymerase III subunit gamma/tau [Chitinivibrio alkaliphilus]